MLSDRLRFRDIRRTSAFRLTVILGTLFLIGIVLLLGLIYGLTAHELTARSDRILRDEAAQWLAVPAPSLPARVLADLSSGDRDLNYGALFARDGERIVGNITWVDHITPDRPIDIAATPTHRPLRLLAEVTPSGETILVGRDISQIRDLRERILTILVSSGLFTAVGMALAALALSSEPLRRVRNLQRASRAIAAGRLDVRMPIAGRHDELDQFALTVNVMVDEVARLLEQVKGVTDAIAHDLRSPLTRVRAQLHRARHLSDTAPPLADLLGDAESDLELVLDRFAALLRISEIEAGARQAAFAPTDLAKLLADVVALYEPLAEERDIALTLTTARSAAIMCDRKLLFEAISNLVDNAIKFGGGRVAIVLARDRDGLSLDVRDDGQGIPDSEREAVLRRFHRGAKAAGYPGTGLGLSIVAAILHLHGFTLELLDGKPGLIARLRIPVGQPSLPPR
ncbi:HAMP domain-containing sensor histidine kinase [Sphingomonas sp. AR_OL41]|uniref:sensor histidine kinase n=1 Tax=Sphingomonas sp. AR_OL41 TaxID=3042729 RepID=UPI0024811049|nr:HAMP domain-containing sensor histidine kinase [Sphingomonas sp. AR_OL41]MDH7975008.1 HAMP domain-containing sensor histidine kinase [Sphingomonas sp. AR_OL41]